MAVTELIPGRSGGMFLRCTEGHMTPPPQEVRDAIRGHRDGVAAIQQGGDADARDDPPTVETAPPPEPTNEAGAPHGGAALPSGEAHDPAFAEAAGIAPEPAQPVAHAMSRTEADEAMQAILGALTAAKQDKARPERYDAAKTVLEAHGYAGDGLTSWLMRNPNELPGLLRDLNVEQGALPL